MFLAHVLGFVLLTTASVASSVSMNFQKLAQYQTEYTDPRSRQLKHPVPLTSYVWTRPLFIVALILSAAASILDLIALAWLPATVIGVFGSLSIIINLCVTHVILFEKPSKEEYSAICFVVIGCLLAMSTTSTNNTIQLPPQLLERPQSYIYIVFNWIVFILIAAVLENGTVSSLLAQLGYPLIGGAIGAQNVCMGKYIAYTVKTSLEVGHLTVRADVLTAVVLLCISSVVMHVIWLNKGLKKYDAYYCIIVYQTAWFIFTILTGIIVYDDMVHADLWTYSVFVTGISSAVFGVWKISSLYLKQNAG